MCNLNDRNSRQEELKQVAVTGAMEWIEENFDLTSELKIGVGSGTTVAYSFPRLADYDQLTAIPTSSTTREELSKRDVNVMELEGCEGRLAFDLDGADEVDPRLNLIKGGGGCHYREKMVANRSDLLLIAVDQSKLVDFLGQTFPLPVEIRGEKVDLTCERLMDYGEPRLRRVNGDLFQTDNENVIVDLQLKRKPGQAELAKWEREINRIEGVVENGLFVSRKADRVFVGTEKGLEVLEPKTDE